MNIIQGNVFQNISKSLEESQSTADRLHTSVPVQVHKEVVPNPNTPGGSLANSLHLGEIFGVKLTH